MSDSEFLEELANLPSDQYYIRNDDQFAGRRLAEDKSLNPKKVYCPIEGSEVELWELKRLDNGHYKISARGAPTKEIHDLLFALVIDRAEPDEWIITKRRQEGHRPVYTIQKATDGKGWVRQHHVPDPQIAVRHLKATKSIPPQFEGGALWNIQPLVN